MKKICILFIVLAFVSKISAQIDETLNPELVKTLVVLYDIKHKKAPKEYEVIKAMILVSGSKIIKVSFRQDNNIMINVSDNRNENIYSFYPRFQVLIFSERKNNRVANSNKFIVIKTNSTKDILGLKCNEYKILNVSVNDNSIIGNDFIYACNEINGYQYNCTEYRDIPGVVLGWTTKDWGMSMNPEYGEVTSISEQYLDSSLFNIPPDYSILTFDEFNVYWPTYQKGIASVSSKEFLSVKDAETIQKWNQLFETLSRNAVANPVK